MVLLGRALPAENVATASFARDASPTCSSAPATTPRVESHARTGQTVPVKVQQGEVFVRGNRDRLIEAVMHLLEQNIRARDVVTRKSLENAARVVACTGGSTNAGLHLPAMAHEAGIDFFLDDVCEIFRDTPYFVDLKPGGQFVAKDLYDAGGIPVHSNMRKRSKSPSR